MNTATDISAIQNLGLAARPETKSRDKLGQDQFLKLMITQIQSQDPFKPLENGEFLSQMAQFGTVSGIQDLQKSFEGLSNSLVSNQALQASALVGRSIVVNSDTFKLAAGTPLEAAVDLDASASNLTVDIVDGSNQVIKTIQLGNQVAGQVNFSWDGIKNSGAAAPLGVYRMQAKGIIGGTSVAVQTQVTEKVESVTLGVGQQGLILNTLSKASYAFNQVKQVK